LCVWTEYFGTITSTENFNHIDMLSIVKFQLKVDGLYVHLKINISTHKMGQHVTMYKVNILRDSIEKSESSAEEKNNTTTNKNV
jgi:hypothetical protein